MNNDQNEKFEKTRQEAIAKHKLTFGLSGTDESTNLEKSESDLFKVLQQSTGSVVRKAPALAFSEPPNPNDNYLGIYKQKKLLIPDEILKQIRVQDHLVATILRARGSMLSLFGHLRKDRFDVGVEVIIKPEFFKILTPEQYEKTTARMKRFENLLLNCGHTEGVEHQDRLTLAEFIDISIRNGLTFGRFSSEVIYDRSGEPDEEGNYPFHRFRPTDPATIVRAIRKGENVGNTIRATAIKALESITGEKIAIDLDKLKEDKYAWYQMIDGTPRQAFTHDEMLVFNLFPSTDIEHNGYPVSPLDTIISSVTTHISIDAYKKLYFQSGRASKGMLVIKSDDVDQQTMDNLKMQFSASINSVSNSFRTPIFGIGSQDEVSWMSMVGEGMAGDEFGFMFDAIARVILAAFSMSPDELPGYSHLSKGSNSQTLSESGNEYKMTAARDTGLRPLIMKFQTFLNQRLFPIMDPLLSRICEIKFSGLDAASKEQESTRLQQDSALHMSMDDLLISVDKDPIGAAMGGNFSFNERYQLVLDKYSNVGEIRSNFFKDPGSIVDPLLQFKRDPFHLQFIQLLAQTNPAAVQALFAPKPYALDFLKMNISDILEEDED